MKRITLAILLLAFAALAEAQDGPKTIYSYAVGNWRNGPVVVIGPLFETTEQATTPQLIARMRAEHAAFKDIADIDVQRFATREEGEESRTTLRAKYQMRKLEVRMLDAPVPKAP